MKRIIGFLILFLILTGCSNQKETSFSKTYEAKNENWKVQDVITGKFSVKGVFFNEEKELLTKHNVTIIPQKNHFDDDKIGVIVTLEGKIETKTFAKRTKNDNYKLTENNTRFDFNGPLNGNEELAVNIYKIDDPTNSWNIKLHKQE